jgi:hypothetical protein
MGELTRRQLSALIVVLVLIRGLELAAGLVGVSWMDREQYVSRHRLEVALLTTFHSPGSGAPRTWSVDDLVSQTPIVAEPARCVRLAVPSFLFDVTDLAGWSGTVGDPAHSVAIMTVRFSSAAEARRTMLRTRVTLMRCNVIRMTFPPFDQLSKSYRVSDHSPRWQLGWGRVRYTLSGEDSYEFYARQFGNTLTWTWGRVDKSATARAQAVDQLVARLREVPGSRR